MSFLIRPLVTEKSMQDASLGRYTFEVDIDANKSQIAFEVQKSFSVGVVSVKTITLKGQNKRAGKKRMLTKSSPWKKAIIEVKKGQKIDLFDVTESQTSSPSASAK